MATVPLDTISSLFASQNRYLTIFGALKLVRVLRLNKIISYLRSSQETKATLQLAKLVYYLVLYIHVFGCTWWIIVSSTKTWIPPYAFNSPSLWYDVYYQDLQF